MIVLAASMFDMTAVGLHAAALAEVLFLVVGGVVAALLLYGLRKQRS